MARDYHRDFDVLEEETDWRSVRSTISSGSLVRVCVFDKVGLFEDGLFIDAVDHEFCLRCRAGNLLVVEGKKAVLEHSMGDATVHKLLWKRVICTNHSATRRYYMTRNVPSVCIRYASVDFTWALHGLIDLVVGSVFVLLFERDRPAKVLAMLSGGRDALIGRFGKRP
jgi:rhamnosyltransferase